MACNISYKDGKIIKVLDDSGNPSKLYKEAVDKFGEEKGLEMYLVSKSNSFLDFFAPKINKNNNYEQSNTEYRDRRRWNPSRGNQTLEGAPIIKTRKNITGADPELTYWAEEYARRNNIPYKRQSKYVEVDEQRAKRIAEAYDKMEHNPQDPRVKEAFQNLINQTISQYKILEEAGYKFYFFDETNDPYNGSPYGAMEELRNQKRMGSFATEAGFGSGATQLNVEDNPMLADTGLTWGWGSVNGQKKRVLANDLFRAVHDAFGHGLEGAGFRARGEENAWQAHARLFTGSAVGAITSETRGQNSWLNYGKFGEQNQTAKVEDTIFADQKTGLMPEWTWKEGFDEGVEEFSQEPTLQEVTNYIASNNKTDLELNKNQKADLINVLISTPNFKAEDFYDEFGMFVIPKKYYSRYELMTINEAEVKQAVDSLLNTEFTPNIEAVENAQKINEKNAFGKLINLNPNIVKKEAIKAIVLSDESEVPYGAESFLGEAKNYKKADVLIETLDGEVISAKNNNTEQILPLVVKENFKTDLIDSIQNLSLNTLQKSEEQTKIVLKAIENDLISQGIDAIGLSDKSIDQDLLDYLDTTKNFINSPTKENTKIYAEKSDIYFERDIAPKKDIVKSEKTDRNYIKLNTNKTEEELYESKGLIQSELGKGIYIQTAKESLEELYNNLRTYTEKYPKNTTLEKYVQEQITKQDSIYNNAENAEAIFLYKMYFGVEGVNEGVKQNIEGVKLIKDKNGNLLAPNGKISNLNEEQWKLVRTPEFTAWFGDWQNDPQNASKVVDENGEPLVVYHGTNAKFYEFQNKTGIRGNQFTGSREVKSDTFFFTDDLEYANKASNIRKENFGGSTNIISSFLNIRQPLDFSTFDYQTEEKFSEMTGEYPSQYFGYNDNLDQWWRLFDKDEDDVTSIVKEKGYTGVILAEEVKIIKDKNNYDVETASVKSFGVFNPNQIKSATEIKGTTTEETNDIRYLTKRPQYKNTTKQFTGNYKYLTEDFVSDFYINQLKEKQKNSTKYRNFYKNFEVNEKGINLLNTDDITMQQIEIYADDNLRQYSLISKQIPDLEVEEVNENPRDLVVNNPQTLENYKKDLFRVNEDTIILKDNVETFIKVNDEIYENVEVKGNLSTFAKIKTEKSDYYQYNIKQPKTNIKLSDYNYLSTQEELFTSPKKYLNKEEKNQIKNDKFNC